MSGQRYIRDNVRLHDRIADVYEQIHPELFCPAEQNRLAEALGKAASAIRSNSSPGRALDYGCGTGNLTRRLIELGLHTTAADVSGRFLSRVRDRFGASGMLKTLRVGGQDLSEIEDRRFDLAATYSVLHHVPDYLKMVAELARVTAPGGVVYIDHEGTDIHWRKDDDYARLMEILETNRPKPPAWKKLFQPVRYWWRFRRLINPRFQPEGDIHVWPDDHVERDKVESVLCECDLEIILRQEYLFPSPWYPPKVFEQYKDKCRDTCLIIARKPAE